MFCGECGTKNKKNATFCESCGAKLTKVEEQQEQVEDSVSKSVPSTKKPMTKKQKIMLVAAAVVAVVLIIAYKSIESQCTPKAVADEYLEAIKTKDYKYLYEHSGYEGDTSFLTLDGYKSVMADNMDDYKISNAKYNNVEFANNGLKATVKYDVVVKDNSGDSNTGTIKVELIKESSKKYMFFDNWSLKGSDEFKASTIKDYVINVPKGTKITFNGKKVADKYKTNDDNKTIYTLPQVFYGDVKLSAKLSNGMTIKKTISTSNYSYYLSVSKKDFTSKEQKELAEVALKTLNTSMTGIIENKSFDDIKKNFASETLEDFEEEYEDAYDDWNDSYSSTVLKEFKASDATISSISFDDDYNLQVTIKYNYNAKLTRDEESKDKNRTSQSFTCYLTYEDGSYKAIDIGSLPYIYWYY